MPEPTDGAVRDERRPPYCYQTHAALDAVRAAFDGNRRPTALAVYLSLTEAANRAGGADARNGFSATRKDIAEAAGVSADTLDRYVADLEAAGLVRRERRRVGNVNLPNVWVLLEPGPVPPLAAPVRPGGSRADAAQELKEDLLEKGNPSGSSQPPPLRKVPVPGRDRPQNLAFNALADECGIVEGDPRSKEVVAALNGSEGIRALFWRDCIRYVQQQAGNVDEAVELGHRLQKVHRNEEFEFERALEAAIHTKAAKYRRAMDGAFLTPGALRKWWVSVESMQDKLVGLTPDEIRRMGDAR